VVPRVRVLGLTLSSRVRNWPARSMPASSASAHRTVSGQSQAARTCSAGVWRCSRTGDPGAAVLRPPRRRRTGVRALRRAQHASPPLGTLRQGDRSSAAFPALSVDIVQRVNKKAGSRDAPRRDGRHAAAANDGEVAPSSAHLVRVRHLLGNACNVPVTRAASGARLRRRRMVRRAPTASAPCQDQRHHASHPERCVKELRRVPANSRCVLVFRRAVRPRRAGRAARGAPQLSAR